MNSEDEYDQVLEQIKQSEQNAMKAFSGFSEYGISRLPSLTKTHVLNANIDENIDKKRKISTERINKNLKIYEFNVIGKVKGEIKTDYNKNLLILQGVIAIGVLVVAILGATDSLAIFLVGFGVTGTSALSIYQKRLEKSHETKKSRENLDKALKGIVELVRGLLKELKEREAPIEYWTWLVLLTDNLAENRYGMNPEKHVELALGALHELLKEISVKKPAEEKNET